MTGCPSRARDEELLLAKISAAAGRQRLGKRRVTYPGVPAGPRPDAANGLALLKAWCAGVVVVCAVAAVVCGMKRAVLAAIAAAVVGVVSLGVLAFAQVGPRKRAARSTSRHARLDLYEHGLTVAVEGRIHAVRYDTTTIVRNGVDYTLTDVNGARIVLRGGSERGTAAVSSHGEFRAADEWGPEIQRAVRG
ncbi:hypothetical protein [Amycolatopsis minnesotensis]|uniref:PH (Pleckstrin Homology) domain-containing protein n=1 Tax=Amycolatopsis minnesotensis TaxID=337894 RepID=A0ABP5E0E0_9PSEU